MTTQRHSFVAKMPNEPGALHKAAEVLKRHDGNIERIQYDLRIDPNTVFFELTAEDECMEAALAELDGMGYLRKTIPIPAYLKFDVTLPNRPGALFELLEKMTASGSNIAFLDYDETVPRGGPLRVAVVLDDGSAASELLDMLKSSYPLDILEHSDVDPELDGTLFYVRFAHDVRGIVPDVDEGFLMRFLNDSNHITQELTRRGEDPRAVLKSIIDSGRMLRESVSHGCCQTDSFSIPGGLLHCIQFPCGGNAYVIDAESKILIDTGFGVYREYLTRELEALGCPLDELDAVLITHGDADHCGSSACMPVPVHMTEEAWEITRRNDRAYGSEVEGDLLESFYTRMINLFSDFRPVDKPILLQGGKGECHGLEVQDELCISGTRVLVLKGLGGHQEGQVFYLIPEKSLLFTGDSLINFDSLTTYRKDYMTLAKVLMTTVNVHSDKAREEREALLGLIHSYDDELMICPGHGSVSEMRGGRLVQRKLS